MVVAKTAPVPLQAELQNMFYYTGCEAEAQLLNSDRCMTLVPTLWVPKEFGMSLTALLYLKHKAVTIWNKGEERKTVEFEKEQGRPGNHVRSL